MRTIKELSITARFIETTRGSVELLWLVGLGGGVSTSASSLSDAVTKLTEEIRRSVPTAPVLTEAAERAIGGVQ